MRQIGIRELRNNTSRAVRRAMAGERLVVTINGVPAAQLAPLNSGNDAASIDDLIASGLVRRPRVASPAPPPRRHRAPSGRRTEDVLREHRSR